MRLEDGVLLSESASFQVLRCAEQDGKVAWRCEIGEAFSQPISVGDDVYVATDSGRLIALDAESGRCEVGNSISAAAGDRSRR